ncbi:hypothetical protein NH26_14385 [Flammeovirga pacifica]|uniref:Uncharacterized protein n=1 Tax=Flammeovirga pacifica TaxID=915059 RepID=A0A1S1Z2E1_FLAPC|nr:hypothetical protein NH26_14385 [Flammeovirga pacifica]
MKLYEKIIGEPFDINKHKRDYNIEDSIIFSIRENKIVKKVINNQNKNLVLLYGEGHFINLKNKLIQNGYSKI